MIFYIGNTVSFDLDQDWLAAFANRMEDSSDIASGGGRTDRWMKSMENLFKNPWGGVRMNLDMPITYGSMFYG